MKKSSSLSAKYRVAEGGKFRIADVEPGDTGGIKSKSDARELLAAGSTALAELQEKLYAQDKWAVLLIFQAMDAAGKDGTIKHVMSGVNPQGCRVTPFKAPTHHELDHDFLWRANQALPARGEIGIFNRSYYEEMLVVRVHPEHLEAQRIPETLVTEAFGRSASKTSTPTSGISRATALRSGSSSSTSRPRNRKSAFWSGWRSRRSTGNLPARISRSASSLTITLRRTRS
jgi:polyphosphate kinase 2 (PPK2 family)